ncbi:hypothetical protein L228DRAFT_259203 [Xylona heveae TC161]|uniref:GRF-like zinc ribbon domain-containing protein n=1 Tax=Xylona heveae (strain CBS 132557 / TC161) TaxID=1328760 RepID=A0A165HTG2_XYLHT|nr:hypothetical protein L228DRAFT_259203 [Xylona heveae TC161]KZF23914.1 hypothetical protein L228DRAFT_259203 [Xylona heveae TC161]
MRTIHKVTPVIDCISFDLLPDGSVELADPPCKPPLCILCHRPSHRFVTRSSNRNGNAGRPYYKCSPCGKFLCFDDRGGNSLRNPPCFCDVSSKLQVTGRERTPPRKLHYVGRLGQCNFYRQCYNRMEEEVPLSEKFLDNFAHLGIA